MITGVAYDNVDSFVQTRTGKDTLHDTVGIIYQDIQNEEERRIYANADIEISDIDNDDSLSNIKAEIRPEESKTKR